MAVKTGKSKKGFIRENETLLRKLDFKMFVFQAVGFKKGYWKSFSLQRFLP